MQCAMNLIGKFAVSTRSSFPVLFARRVMRLVGDASLVGSNKSIAIPIAVPHLLA